MSGTTVMVMNSAGEFSACGLAGEFEKGCQSYPWKIWGMGEVLGG